MTLARAISRLRRTFQRGLRGCIALLLVPLMVLQVFGGVTYLAHAHDGHGTHLHIAGSPDAAITVARSHLAFHAAGHTHHESSQASGCDHADDAHADHAHTFAQASILPADHQGEPHGLLVTIPDHEQVNARAVSAVAAPQPVNMLVAMAWVLAPVPDVSQNHGSPGGQAHMHLAGMTTSQRLVRTSGALLL
ncbi:MAG TPA: hypothetical protein VHN77_07245 [Phycisphaerales bacterium]|nr:hypothetical protein [Phycisphaerales bacterium]